MCSEALFWRCHRLLISNTLFIRGLRVFHILGPGKVTEHELGNYGARPEIREGQLIYPGEAGREDED